MKYLFGIKEKEYNDILFEAAASVLLLLRGSSHDVEQVHLRKGQSMKKSSGAGA